MCVFHLGLLLHDREDPLNSNADPHTWHFSALGVKHAHQTVVSSSAGHAAHAYACLITRHSTILLCRRGY